MSDIRRTGISSITIENFKGIGEKVTIPLKPITLLFGANSSGKSTVLQALLYAHEVLNNRNPDADVTEFGGEKINLGGFRNLVHGHDLSREIKIAFEYTLDDDGLPLYGPERNYRGNIGDKLFYDTSVFRPLKSAAIAFSVCAPENGMPMVSSYKVSINKEVVAEIRSSIPRGNAFFHQMNFNPVIDEESTLPEAEAVSLAAQHVSFEDENVLPYWGQILPMDISVDMDCLRNDGPDESVIYALLSALISGPGELIAKELEQMRYIGPIRSVPPRNYVPQKTKNRGRWADGMAGWDLLLNDIIAGKKWFEQSAYDRLQIGYEFVKCREITVPDGLLEKMGETPFVDVIQKMTSKNTVRMRDVESQTEVEPCDVGTGVSQVIPVVAGAMSPGCRFLSVEQPELHLHPAIQCNLGDLFISQTKRYPERTFLLETHSEHLILRLLRRIRETSEGHLDDKTLTLTPNDVGVLYVEEAEPGVRIKELPITEDGDFAEKWPQGFFEERAEELF